MIGPRETWDAGVPPERTRLAWQRTSLALLTASLVVARFVGHLTPVAGVVIAALALVLAGALGVVSTRRYRRAHLLHRDRTLEGGAANLLMTLALLVVGAGAGVFLLLSAR